jgi:hypothetical protein
MGLTFSQVRNGEFVPNHHICNTLIIKENLLSKIHAFWTNFFHANFMPKIVTYPFEFKGEIF